MLGIPPNFPHFIKQEHLKREDGLELNNSSDDEMDNMLSNALVYS